jgi:hypothetical protein
MILKQTTEKGKRRHYLRIEKTFRRISAAEFLRRADEAPEDAIIISNAIQIVIIW